MSRSIPTPLGIAGVLIALAGATAAHTEAQGDPTSPCRVTATVEVVPKLVCPLEPATATFRFRPTCPAEHGGAASVGDLTLAWPLPAGVRAAEDAAGSAEPEVPEWRFRAPPTSGVTATIGLEAVRPGVYRLGDEATYTLVDDRGRQARARLDGAAAWLTASPACERRVLFLPYLRQPRCTPSAQAADIMVLVDRSTSIGPAGLDQAAAEGRAFFDSLNLARDRVGVIVFDQAAQVRAPLGSDRDALLAAFDDLPFGVGTAIDRAIRAGAAHLEAHSTAGRRRVLVLLTDGVQAGPSGRADVVTAADAARARDIAILTAALGPAPDRALLAEISSRPDDAIAAPGPHDLGTALQALAEVAGCTVEAW